MYTLRRASVLPFVIIRDQFKSNFSEGLSSAFRTKKRVFFKLSVCLHDERRLLNTFLKLNVHDIRMNQKVEDTTQSNMVYVVKEKETYQTGTQVSSTFNPIIESDNLSKNRPVSTDLREFLFSKLFVLKIIFFKKLSDWKTSAVLLTFNSTDFIT